MRDVKRVRGKGTSASSVEPLGVRRSAMAVGLLVISILLRRSALVRLRWRWAIRGR